MITTLTPAEQRTVLRNISWETFETLLKETGEDRGSRFAYDCGTLEIMTPLFEHENPKSNFGNFIVALAEELNIEIKSAGSTTLKRRIVNRGIEPDNCYYIQNEPAIRSNQTLDLATDPPPEITISPLHKIEVELIVFMFVQDTSVSCFVASPIIYVELSTLSVFRLEKFVFTCHLKDAPVIQSFNVVIVDIGLN